MPRTGPTGPLCGASLPAVWDSPAPPPACRRASKFSHPGGAAGLGPADPCFAAARAVPGTPAGCPLRKGALLAAHRPSGPLCGASLPAVWDSPAPPPACRRANKRSTFLSLFTIFPYFLPLAAGAGRATARPLPCSGNIFSGCIVYWMRARSFRGPGIPRLGKEIVPCVCFV